MTRARKWRIAGGIMAVLFVAGLGLAHNLAWRIAVGPVEGTYFESEGVRIHYTDEGQGTPVVLVHGLANNGYMQWKRFGRVEKLAQSYRVITVDNRGHGSSGKPHDPDQYGVEMVEDLVRLLDHLKIDKAHMVGYSMGGFIVLKMVALHPDRILSAAPCAAGWEQDDQKGRAFAEAVANSLAKGEPGPLPERLGVKKREFSFLEKLAGKVALSYFNDAQALAAVARASVQMAVTEAELRANQVPTLTIIGSEDGLLPDAKELAEYMANHELLILEGKNHMNADVSPDFLQALQSFLAKHNPAPARQQEAQAHP
jgi:pimeloyl-ACP methyl ester carboxylesterase